MNEISRFYQEISNLIERIDSLIEEDKYIKIIFSSILDREKELQSKVIRKVSQNYKILMHTSLSCRETKAKEVKEWAKNAEGQCLIIW